MSITAGVIAPDFELPDQTGKIVRLSDLRGSPVVLYFYPKDDTPGCTVEACEFRDSFIEYQQAGIIILGISPDDSKMHSKFIAKYSLPFSLLADTDKSVVSLYGVWGPKKYMGKSYDGVYRTTFLIDTTGMVLKVFDNVRPEGHSKEVLQALSKN